MIISPCAFSLKCSQKRTTSNIVQKIRHRILAKASHNHPPQKQPFSYKMLIIAPSHHYQPFQSPASHRNHTCIQPSSHRNQPSHNPLTTLPQLCLPSASHLPPFCLPSASHPSPANILHITKLSIARTEAERRKRATRDNGETKTIKIADENAHILSPHSQSEQKMRISQKRAACIGKDDILSNQA